MSRERELAMMLATQNGEVVEGTNPAPAGYKPQDPIQIHPSTISLLCREGELKRFINKHGRPGGRLPGQEAGEEPSPLRREWAGANHAGSCSFCVSETNGKVLRVWSEHPCRAISVKFCPTCAAALF